MLLRNEVNDSAAAEEVKIVAETQPFVLKVKLS
jgi:hypothetical protein